MPDPTDNVQTITVRPEKAQGGEGKPIAAGAKLTRDQVSELITQQMPGLSKAGVEGVVRNVIRESGGNSGDDTGDHGTSGGLFQHHNTRLTGLKDFAKAQGTDWKDPTTQVKFAATELKRDYPTLLTQLQHADDPAEAEDSFKRVFERPASIMWENKPRLATDNYRYSDYALGEHKGRKGTDMVYMSPADYLDLSPDLEGKPFDSPSGRSIRGSVDRGEDIESVPSLSMKVDGKTGQVTDQDGRHRALLAQEHGVDAIPVAIHKTGEGDPTEIQGLSGNVIPNDFQKADTAPKSLLSRIGNAILPSAEAAEPPNPFADLMSPDVKPGQKPAAPGAGSGGGAAVAPSTDNPFADLMPKEPDGVIGSAARGFSKAIGDTVYGGQELIGKGLSAVGATGIGQSMVDDARTREREQNDLAKPDEEAHPYASTAGRIAGDVTAGLAIPGGPAMRVTGNALKDAAIAGGIGGLLQPASGNDKNYWADKAGQALIGAGGGAIGEKVLGTAANALAPKFSKSVDTLLKEGVELTPGQMKGGAAQTVEDKAKSVPLLGDAINAAARRGMQSFNRAAINRSLADINTKLPDGVVGHEAIGEAKKLFNKAYDQVIPSMKGIRDPAFVGDLNAVMAKAQQSGLPQEYQQQLQHIIQTEILNRFDANGHITGTAAQDVGTMLDGIMNPLKIGNVYQQQLGRAVLEADKALDNMMAAHNPALQAAKDRIDAGYSKFKTVQRAAASVGTDADGVFTPAQLNRAISARDRTKDKAAFAQGDAQMQDLAKAGREVLTAGKDSGTSGREAIRHLLSGTNLGVAWANPATALGLLGLTGAAAAPYTAKANRLTNAIMGRLAQRPMTQASNALRLGASALAPAAGIAAAPIPQMVIRPGQQPQ